MNVHSSQFTMIARGNLKHALWQAILMVVVAGRSNGVSSITMEQSLIWLLHGSTLAVPTTAGLNSVTMALAIKLAPRKVMQ